jgi:hypothetical protein
VIVSPEENGVVYEMIYAVGLGILLGVGGLSLYFSPAIQRRIVKPFMFVGSVLILLTGFYFFLWWHEQREKIQVLSQRIKFSMNQYPSQNKNWRSEEPDQPDIMFGRSFRTP